jgi:hypothetical protein
MFYIVEHLGIGAVGRYPTESAALRAARRVPVTVPVRVTDPSGVVLSEPVSGTVWGLAFVERCPSPRRGSPSACAGPISEREAS